MRASRYLYLIALSAWLGGKATLGILVAPATFEALEAHDPALRRALGGDVFGGMLRLSLFDDIPADVERNAATDAGCSRAVLRMSPHRSLCRFTLAGRYADGVVHTNAGDPEDPIDGFDLPFHHSADLVRLRRNLAHFQCACQRAEQSTADGGDHVIERGRDFLFRLDPIELFDPSVHTEPDRLAKVLEVGVPDRSLHPFDPHATCVYQLSHSAPPCEAVLSSITLHHDKPRVAECSDPHRPDVPLYSAIAFAFNHTAPVLQSSSMQPSSVTRSIVRSLACALTFLFGATVAAAQQEGAPPGVVNYTRVDATVACAGATPPEAIAELKRLGFTSIINFRTAQERGASIEASQAAAREIGLKYFHLPFRTPSVALTESFLNTVADPANQPVFIHCGSANRVGAMWLIKRVKLDGWDVEKAAAEAEAIGLRSAGLKEFALDYVK